MARFNTEYRVKFQNSQMQRSKVRTSIEVHKEEMKKRNSLLKMLDEED